MAEDVGLTTGKSHVPEGHSSGDHGGRDHAVDRSGGQKTQAARGESGGAEVHLAAFKHHVIEVHIAAGRRGRLAGRGTNRSPDAKESSSKLCRALDAGRRSYPVKLGRMRPDSAPLKSTWAPENLAPSKLIW